MVTMVMVGTMVTIMDGMEMVGEIEIEWMTTLGTIVVEKMYLII
jgi:hypothetical protein